ncbi:MULTISPECIES: Tn3 family transposase [Streptomyces]|uniref:Tn3 transposase DDE domain-containing protein n=1 Tax=Streptomyces canarius TaxID=285453 RepID=A0ABQ3D3A2_9ACTN|nr:Tn3 family transposase [Streptomyces canarius]GHA56537.1 hypothetical protein GCM10010345_71290 [Streptomyces canarius]
MLDLLDVLKNADFLTDFIDVTDEFASVAAYERMDRALLQWRLLLALFALDTHMGIRAIVATGEHGETEAALRYVRRHFITVDNLRAAVTRLVNGTLAAWDAAWWGQGPACASDSKKSDREVRPRSPTEKSGREVRPRSSGPGPRPP